MKKNTSNSRLLGIATKTVALLAAIAAFSNNVNAQDTVYVTSYLGSSLSPEFQYTGTAGTDYSPSGSTAIASPPGVPARTKCVYGFSSKFAWTITPYLNVAGAVYKIEVAHTPTTTSANVLVTASTSDGVLSASCTNSPVFDAAHGGNTWQLLGYITNNPGVNMPAITFKIVGGDVGPTSTANRLYVDAFKFTEVNACLGVAEDVSVSGPLADGQNFVPVLGVNPAASSVTVYADGNVMGELKAPSIVAGSNSVPTIYPLFRGSQIRAVQTVNGCTSSLPASGPVVGGGANPSVMAFLSLWQNSTFAGPVGTNTTAGLSTNYILKATGLRGGSQTASYGGEQLNPSTCWQTVTFDHATDPGLYPNSGLNATNKDSFCALDALVFAIDPNDLNSGPYEIYIDQIKNGDTVIEDFESYDVNTTNTFIAPNGAGTPSPSATYLASPNSSTISTNNAFDGTKSLRVTWQWLDADFVRWARIPAAAATGKHYPQLDTKKPITIRYLILPVGEKTNKLSFPVALTNQTKGIGESVTFSVTAAGEGPFTYQWQYKGADIPGANTSSYTKSNLQLGDSGVYSVIVTGNGGSGCTQTSSALLSVQSLPPKINYSLSGSTLTLSWTGSYNLQAKTNLNQATWNNVGVSTSPYVTTVTNAATFYRLQTP